MNRLKGIVIILFLFSTVGAIACEFSFTITGDDGFSRKIRPGSDITLNLDETYTLTIYFNEDHGRCPLTPEDTYFLLDEEKWKSSKDYLSLRLFNDITWVSSSSRRHSAEIIFNTETLGASELEIIRECDKGGYDEILSFVVN